MVQQVLLYFQNQITYNSLFWGKKISILKATQMMKSEVKDSYKSKIFFHIWSIYIFK